MLEFPSNANKLLYFSLKPNGLIANVRTFCQQNPAEQSSSIRVSDYSRFDPNPKVSREHLLRKPEEIKDSKLLNVAIIGRTNAGKSVLTNALVGAPVSGVSSKCHTTRRVTRGITVCDTSQLIFQDTPGFLTDNVKNKDVEKEMLTDPENSLLTAQLIIVLHDISNKFTCKRLDSRVLHLLFKYRHIPSVLALNKVDLVKNKSVLLEIISNLTCGRVNGLCLSQRPIPAMRRAEGDPSLDRMARLSQIMSEQELKSPRVNDSAEQSIVRHAQIDDWDNLQREIESEKLITKNDIMCENSAEIDQSAEDNSLIKKVEDSRIILSAERLKFNRQLWPDVDWKTLDKLDQTPMHKIPRSQLKKCFLNVIGWPCFSAVFSLSALYGNGVENLKRYLTSKAISAPWKYHSSIVSPLSTIQLVKEIVRATVMDHVRFNLPYTLKYQIVSWEVNEHDTLCILMNIICEHERMINMIAGRQLYKLKTISTEASQQLSDLFGRDVYLKFNVVPLKRRRQ